VAKVGLWEHFARLFDFRGSEDRASFWPFAALAFVIIMIAGGLIFVPMMLHSMRAMQDYATQHPDQTTITQGPGQYSISVQGHHPEFFPMETMATYLAVTFGLAILLYAAAVARRLHDRGKSGLWGLLPLPFIIYSSIMMPMLFTSPEAPNVGLFLSMFLSNLLYMVTLIWLIVMLAGPSSPNASRDDLDA
jgi:uncharacterized membrane protein YhaH (DUF805 family)